MGTSSAMIGSGVLSSGEGASSDDSPPEAPFPRRRACVQTPRLRAIIGMGKEC